MGVLALDTFQDFNDLIYGLQWMHQPSCARTVPAASQPRPIAANATHDERGLPIDVCD